MISRGKHCVRVILPLSISIALLGCAAPGGNDSLRGASAEVVALPDQQLSNLTLARAEFGRGNYGNAIAYLERELSQKPVSVAALNGLGACYDQMGRYDVAQRYYFRALDLAPDSSVTLSNIGYSYLKQGRSREAVQILELALQKDAGNKVAASNLAMAINRSGDNPGEGMPVAETDPQAASPLQRLLAGGNDSLPARVLAVPPQQAVEREVIAVAPVEDTASPAPVASLPEPDLPQAQPAPMPPTDPQDPPVATLSEVAAAPPGPAAPEIAPPPPPEAAPPLPLVARVVGQPVLAAEPAGFLVEPAVQQPQAEEEMPRLTLTIIEAPEFNPALASDRPQAAVPVPRPVNIAVKNGNGVRGIARATSTWLANDKRLIRQVADADTFDYRQTVILHRPEMAAYAQQIAASLDLTCDIRPSDELEEGIDMQVVLGHDFASRVAVDNGWLEFNGAPEGAYLVGSLRLEISNGNGVAGMAARMRDFLQDRGGQVVRLTNAESFDQDRSVLYYRAGSRVAAEALAASLPMSDIDLLEAGSLAGDIEARLLLGRDVVPVDFLTPD